MPFNLNLCPVLGALALLTACGAKPGDAAQQTSAAPTQAAAPAPPANPNQISVSPAQAQAAGIAFGTFERQNMTTEVQANGSVEVPPQNRVSITAVQGGYVQTVRVLPGEHVRAQAPATAPMAAVQLIPEPAVTAAPGPPPRLKLARWWCSKRPFRFLPKTPSWARPLACG
ncbi:MAG: hypothetical protein ACRYFR_11930 [Janthinobacterium lividum]